jgi:hypothetical protein
MAIPRYQICTIWSKGTRDPFTGLDTLGTARVYKCSVRRGGKTKLSDRTGSEFYPASTFWVRLSDLVSGTHAEPQEGEVIAKGDHSGISDPSEVGGEIIRAVMVHDHTKFGESESYTIGTNA